MVPALQFSLGATLSGETRRKRRPQHQPFLCSESVKTIGKIRKLSRKTSECLASLNPISVSLRWLLSLWVPSDFKAIVCGWCTSSCIPESDLLGCLWSSSMSYCSIHCHQFYPPTIMGWTLSNYFTKGINDASLFTISLVPIAVLAVVD